MLKRTKGRLLLTLLVITGLAGTMKDSALSQKERKGAIGLLKNSREELLKSVEGLTAKQWRFKASADQLSIEEYIYFTAGSEMKAQELLKSTMKNPSNPEKRLEIKYMDNQLREMAQTLPVGASALSFQPNATHVFKRPVDAMVKFQSIRQEYIRYIRTSTEDMRDHVIKTPDGWMDCYQYILALAIRSKYVTEEVKRIKSEPGFPR